MTCPKATCGKAMGEDEKFGYDMRLLGLPQRRYYCSDGHSLTTGIPAAADLEPKIVPGQYRHLAGQTRRLANLQPEAPKVPRLENVCRNGHPRTEENTHVGPDGRRCRVCQRDFVAFRRSQSTACRRGHVYTPETMRMRVDGSRRCLVCLANSEVGRWKRMPLDARAKRNARERAARRQRRAHACIRGHAYGESNPYRRGKWCVVCKTEQQVQRLERMSVGLVAAH
jgi:hypothetical protein